jgi:hypothetical protein
MKTESQQKPATFEPLPHLERLLALRERDEHQFILQTSEATRASLEFYERAKEQAKH